MTLEDLEDYEALFGDEDPPITGGLYVILAEAGVLVLTVSAVLLRRLLGSRRR